MKNTDAHNLFPYIASFMGGALIFIFIALAYVSFMSMKEPRPVAPTPAPVQTPSESTTTETPTPSTQTATTAPVTSSSEGVTIDWEDGYVPVDPNPILRRVIAKTALSGTIWGVISSVSADYPGEMALLGEVKDGPLRGYKLYEYTAIATEMASYGVELYVLIENPVTDINPPIYISSRCDDCFIPDNLDQNDPNYAHYFENVFEDAETAKTVTIANFKKRGVSGDEPTKLTLSSGATLYLVSDDYPTISGFRCISCRYSQENDYYKKALRTQEGMWLYHKPGVNTLIGFSSAGEPFAYESRLSDADLNNITWSSGYANTQEFKPQPEYSGCFTGGLAQVLDPSDLGELVQVGKTASGELIYAPKNIADNSITKSTYDQWYTYGSLGDKPTYEEFLRSHPVPFFVWKNAFGDWIRYGDVATTPAVECGKPVIYLYPKKETPVHVELPSFVNVTVSEPTYPRGGWDTVAKPNGELTMKDGSVYGSLFWEGTGVKYTTPETGFVVARGDAESFLAMTLPKYGLNQTETKEFMDFWVPRLQKAPYYRVSFLTDEFNKAAPLNVTPKPDTVIRLFMDLKPLSSPIKIQAPNIVTPKRNGFTLVEWGGLLYR